VRVCDRLDLGAMMAGAPWDGAIAGVPVLCAIEVVYAFPGQGVSSMFRFGVTYGQVLGLAEALGWPLRDVQPKTWQATTGGGDYGARIAWVHARWPDVSLVPPRCRVPHSGAVDALAIAAWACQTLGWAAPDSACAGEYPAHAVV
jgi:crossover junction endodeoxyribonuclease RuvC